MLTTEFQNFIAGTTEPNDVKYRILVGSVNNLILESGCDIRSGGFLMLDFPNRNKLILDSEKTDTETRPVYYIPRISSTSTSFPRLPLLQEQPVPLSYNKRNEDTDWRRIFRIIPRLRENMFFNF